MTDPNVPAPGPALRWRPDLGGKGTLFPLDADEIETPITPSTDEKIWVSDSSQPSGYREEDLPTGGSGIPTGGAQGQRLAKVSSADGDADWTWEPRGITAEFGDSLAAQPSAGMRAGGRWACAGKLSGIYLDTLDGLTCTCQLDVLVNGVSIFGAGSTKPFLTAGTAYVDTTFAGTVTRAHAKGDQIVVVILSFSGASFGLALTLLTNEDEV